MNFELAKKVSKFLSEDDLQGAIAMVETELKSQIRSDFDQLMGISLLKQKNKLARYISKFHKTVSGKMDVGAIYVEMNDFSINWDMWFVDAFAYAQFGGTDDLDWLGDWEEEGNATTTRFKIKGLEKLQKTWQTYSEQKQYKDKKMEAAADVAELLVVLRVQELVKAAVDRARQKGRSWTQATILVSAHDFDDIIYKVS